VAFGRTRSFVTMPEGRRPQKRVVRGTRDVASETDTRNRVIQAALHSIMDLGFYRGSSTNEIARRAGVTWGVIQHRFGSREALMLAVLEASTEDLEEVVARAHIDGSTVRERLGQLIELLAQHYDTPEYLASLQVILNLEHDPRTSNEVRETMRQAADHSTAHIHRLLKEALGDQAMPKDLRSNIILAIRGFCFSQQLNDSVAYGTLQRPRSRPKQRRELFAEMLAPYFEALQQ
jgi:AcrR family transcriptional regulator